MFAHNNTGRVGRMRLTVVLGVVLAAAVVLVWGAAVSLAADYQDANHNVCEGTFTAPSCDTWGSHVTGIGNVALGDSMMPALTSGFGNVALASGALAANTTGDNNVASGTYALYSNATGNNNLASGTSALYA